MVWIKIFLGGENVGMGVFAHGEHEFNTFRASFASHIPQLPNNVLPRYVTLPQTPEPQMSHHKQIRLVAKSPQGVLLV